MTNLYAVTVGRNSDKECQVHLPLPLSFLGSFLSVRPERSLDMLTAAENASFSEAVLTFGGHRGLEEHRASQKHSSTANFQDTRINCKSCFYGAESQF